MSLEFIVHLCLVRWRLLWTALRVTVVYVRKEYSSSKVLIILMVYCYGDLLSKNLTIVNQLYFRYWMRARFELTTM